VAARSITSLMERDRLVGLGSGMDDYVSALAVSGSDLYVGGGFTKASATPACGIAKWSQGSWSPWLRG